MRNQSLLLTSRAATVASVAIDFSTISLQLLSKNPFTLSKTSAEARLLAIFKKAPNMCIKTVFYAFIFGEYFKSRLQIVKLDRLSPSSNL